jgi:hypothetical protein
VNQFLAGIARPTVEERKRALKAAAFESAAGFADFLAAIKAHADNYDPNIDALGYYKYKAILNDNLPNLQSPKNFDLVKSPNDIFRVAMESLQIFKHHVENGNLWEELWIGNNPKRERAAQLIYHAIADCFCKANNIDITPEGNMGGGPVDFKFSSGYSSRVLVELKRSGGTVRHGYEKQLEFYKEASQTEWGIYVVIDFGDGAGKIRQIEKIRQSRLASGKRASEIIVINARRRESSSKRQ